MHWGAGESHNTPALRLESVRGFGNVFVTTESVGSEKEKEGERARARARERGKGGQEGSVTNESVGATESVGGGAVTLLGGGGGEAEGRKEVLWGVGSRSEGGGGNGCDLTLIDPVFVMSFEGVARSLQASIRVLYAVYSIMQVFLPLLYWYNSKNTDAATGVRMPTQPSRHVK